MEDFHFSLAADNLKYDNLTFIGYDFQPEKLNFMFSLLNDFFLRPYKCQRCSHSFYRNNILKEHMTRCTASSAEEVLGLNSLINANQSQDSRFSELQLAASST